MREKKEDKDRNAATDTAHKERKRGVCCAACTSAVRSARTMPTTRPAIMARVGTFLVSHCQVRWESCLADSWTSVERMRSLLVATLAACLVCCCCGLTWKGYDWKVKQGNGMGPAANNWDSSLVKVVNDEMRFSIKPMGGVWTCSEVNTPNKIFGYGTFYFVVRGAFDKMDPKTVAGLTL